MFIVAAQKFRNTTIIRCHGRLLLGNSYATLRNAVLGQTAAGTVVLDLACVDRVDAGGLATLLHVRDWALGRGIRFKLMNVMPRVERLLKLTRLAEVFEFWTVADMLELVCLSRLKSVLRVDGFSPGGNIAAYEPPAA